jgi:hypothetical protein
MKKMHTFASWMNAVDRELANISGLTSGDLADQNYRDWYDDEMSAAEAAREVLESEGFPLDGLDED